MDKELKNLAPNIGISRSRISQYDKTIILYYHIWEMIASSMDNKNQQDSPLLENLLDIFRSLDNMYDTLWEEICS